MIGIYCFQNKINKKRYIGQSINIHQRYLDHKNNRTNQNFSKAIQKYGFENFDFSILEECTKEELNEKERYWIKFYDSFNNGYNMTTGGDCYYKQSDEANLKHSGEKHPLSILTNEDVYNIRELRLQGISRLEVFELYKDKISLKGFQHIWQGNRWKHVHYDIYDKIDKNNKQKPLISNEIIYNIRLEYMNGISKKELLKKYPNIDRRTIERWLKLQTRTKEESIPFGYVYNN